MTNYRLITNASVKYGNEDYWARLGAIMKENRDMGISNEIYANLALPINNKAFFKRMLEPETIYQNLTR